MSLNKSPLITLRSFAFILVVALMFLVFLNIMSSSWGHRPLHMVTIKVPVPTGKIVNKTILEESEVKSRTTLTTTSYFSKKESKRQLDFLMLLFKLLADFFKWIGMILVLAFYTIMSFIMRLFGFKVPEVPLRAGNRTIIVHEIEVLSTVVGIILLALIATSVYIYYIHLSKKRGFSFTRKYLTLEESRREVKKKSIVLNAISSIFHEIYMKAKRAFDIGESITHRELAKIIEENTGLGDDIWVITLAFEDVKFGKKEVSWVDINYLIECKKRIIKALDNILKDKGEVGLG